MDTVRIVHDGTEYSVAQGTSIESLFTLAGLPLDGIAAALVDREVRALSYRLVASATVEAVPIASTEGIRVYQRSLAFLLAYAAHRVAPDRRIHTGPALGNALFYTVDGDAVTEDWIASLADEMTRIVAEALPIARTMLSWGEARDLFHATGMSSTALLLERRNQSVVPVYRCDGFVALSHGPLVSSTALLGIFRLERHEDGFLLVHPTADVPDAAPDLPRSRVLRETYREYGAWGRAVGVSTVGELNTLIERDEIEEFIQISEALHRSRIAAIAGHVFGSGRIVLVAGPSSSGKTTFTKKLALQLRAMGARTVEVSLDNYFVPRERTPRHPDGSYDFEHVDAIDIPLLNDHLTRLLEGGEVEPPTFNFHTGQPMFDGTTIRIPPGGVLLLEGIHGLNDRLTPRIPRGSRFTIYVSALTQLNLDDHTRISTTDNRLIRRMVRDATFRGHTAHATLQMWPSVRAGEERNIFPFQDSADAVFNSALDYELGALRTRAEALLRHVKPEDADYYHAVRLQTLLENVNPIPHDRIPSDSIVREFIGGSVFHY